MRALILLLGVVLALAYFSGVLKAEAQPPLSQTTSIASTAREDSLAVLRSLHGKRERRLFRLQQWAKSLKGDMKRIYDTYGFPSSRYREATMGRVVERWTYLSRGLEFTFQDTRLIRTRRFIPATR